MPRSYPATTSVGLLLVLLTALFWGSGTLFPDVLPDYADSHRQITGMALMLILAPAYLVGAGIVAQRRSLELVDALRPALPDPQLAAEAQATIRGALRSVWPLGLALGLALGLFNTNPVEAWTMPAAHVAVSLSFGQLVLWTVIGLLLVTRGVSARAFARLGEGVVFDPFRLDALRPLARSGLIDILVIAGALALSPLQALDAAFRWYNYQFALVVAIPSAILFVTFPLWPLHRRIHREKAARLARMDAMLEQLPTDGTPEGLARLETLLAHRDRVKNLPTWPLGSALLYRIVLYLIIPPLAWVGAALVEMLVGRIVSG